MTVPLWKEKSLFDHVLNLIERRGALGVISVLVNVQKGLNRKFVFFSFLVLRPLFKDVIIRTSQSFRLVIKAVVEFDKLRFILIIILLFRVKNHISITNYVLTFDFIFPFWVVFSVKMAIVNYPRKIFGLKNEKLRDFLLKCKVKDTDWPIVITSQIVNQIRLLMYLIIEQFITHRCFLDARIHEEFVQKIDARFSRVLSANSSNSLLIHLLVFKSADPILAPELFDLLIL